MSIMPSINYLLDREAIVELRHHFSTAECVGPHGIPTLVSLPVALIVSGVFPFSGARSWSELVQGIEHVWRERWPGSAGTREMLRFFDVESNPPLPGFLIGLAVKPDALLLNRAKVCTDPAIAAGIVSRTHNDIYLAGRNASRLRRHLLRTALLVDDERIPANPIKTGHELISPEIGYVESSIDMMIQHYRDLSRARS
jgi:hypothetical protein